MISNPKLWQAIERLKLDGRGSLPYSGKLAREEGWSAEDTDRVITEYRRFLYLSQILEAPRAPPEPVDAAWRMHLTYTRSYWDDLISGVLGGVALHRSTEDVENTAHQKTCHAAMVKAYAQEFGAPPPRDIWVRPGQKSVGEVTVSIFLIGFIGGFASLVVGWAGINVFGLDMIEPAFRIVLLLCFALVFGSPLWAWLLTPHQPRLKSTKKQSGTRTTELSVSFSRGDLAD